MRVKTANQRRDLNGVDYFSKRKKRGQMYEVSAISVSNAIFQISNMNNKTKPIASLFSGPVV